MITCVCSTQVCPFTLHSESDQSGPSPGTEYFLHMSFFINMFQIIPHCWWTIMVFTIVLKPNFDMRHKSLDERMMSLHTQKGHECDDWQVMRSKSREVFIASGVARPTRWIFVVSSWTQQAVYYTLERWLVGFIWKNKQKKPTKAWFQKEISPWSLPF